MAIRTRAAWDSIVSTLLQDNATGNISAADMRSVLDDLGDSVIFRGELIDVINDMIGGTSWQTGGGSSGTGITLQQALDAVRATGSVTIGSTVLELSKDTSVDDQITLTLAEMAVASHTRYAAIVDNPNADPADFPASVFTAAGAASSDTDTIVAPGYAGLSTFVTLGFATPNRLTGIMEEGNVLSGNVRDSFAPGATDADVVITIPGRGTHYVYAGIINALQAGNNWILTEETP